MTVLKLAEKSPPDGMVELLEYILKDAKEGKIAEFRLISRYENSKIMTAHSGTPDDVYRMVGALFAGAVSYEREYIE